MTDDTNPDWTLTQKMGLNGGAVAAVSLQLNQNRYEGAALRQTQKIQMCGVQGLLALQDQYQEDAEELPDQTRPMDQSTQTTETTEIVTQTDICAADITVLEAQASNNTATQEGKLMRDSFVNDNKETKFYTGLPTFAVLMLVFNYGTSKLPTRRSVTPF